MQKTIFILLVFICQQAMAQVYYDPASYSEMKKCIDLLQTAYRKHRDVLSASRIQVLYQPSDTSIGSESYKIEREDHLITMRISSGIGGYYGAMDIAESMAINNLQSITSGLKDPSFEVRAIKYNLPWSPYRESQSMEYHHQDCRDVSYWERFLDMMQDYRFNTLLLYNKHPFNYMVRIPEYPSACTLSDAEMEEWENFWNQLFAMAKERGVEVFVVNWNIVIPKSMAEAHDLKEYNDLSETTIDYTRKCVTATINKYKDLSGLGVTLADWMNGQTPEEREEWIYQTFVEGMKAANRPVKFLHRAVLSGSSDAMRDMLNRSDLPYTTLTEVKFNWSHGHSSPRLMITHASESGEVNTGYWQPTPDNYRIQWMIRNEDFWILRWGDPEFIRNHIAYNDAAYVNGYHIGSEGYIPAYDYFTRDKNGVSWKYAFERQWLYYAIWGRLLYDRNTPDQVFEKLATDKYGSSNGPSLIDAFRHVSRMPLRLATFFKATWDYTLYSEGFMAPMHAERYGINDKVHPFISIDELIHHQTLDTSYLSIIDYVKMLDRGHSPPNNVITPDMLANQLIADAERGEMLARQIEQTTRNLSFDLQQELADIYIWSGLGKYFATKIKAGILLARGRINQNAVDKQEAVKYLEECLTIWKTLSHTGDQHYRRVPYWESRVFGFEDLSLNYFSWSHLIPQVERDIHIASE